MITTYDVRNVLRVYGNHLKRKSQFEDAGSVPHGSVDLVDISMGARRKQMLNQISNRLISSMDGSKDGNQQASAPKLLKGEG